MLFYNFAALLSDPLSILAVQDGGMSFHGGFLGVLHVRHSNKLNYKSKQPIQN
jgi:prolipoprotein diacylglyceryltransferase